MSKTVCKCGAEYEDDIPFGDHRVDACQRCGGYARATPEELRMYETARIPVPEEKPVRVVWEPKKPTRVLD